MAEISVWSHQNGQKSYPISGNMEQIGVQYPEKDKKLEVRSHKKVEKSKTDLDKQRENDQLAPSHTLRKVESSGENPRATGGLVSNLLHPRVNKTKQHIH